MDVLSPEVKKFARAYYGAIGTPLAGTLTKFLDEGQWASIAQQRVDPKAYADAASYYDDACVVALLRKLQDLPTPKSDRRARALRNWKKGEADCYKTNERLSPYLEGLSHPSCDPDVFRHIVGIRKIIQSCLGKAPSLDDLTGKFGPGATFSDPAKRSLIADKMNVEPSMTQRAHWFLLPWQQTSWYRACAAATPVRSPRPVRGNRFAVAPKDAEKDRAIAAEPSLNVYYQLSLGLAVRQRLLGVGIDLDNGQSTHKRVARESSITGRFATLDLSNASDTLAYALVKLLLPTSWFELFDELRSPFTKFLEDDSEAILGFASQNKVGGWMKLEKFSSMGNGFTFELETLIFFAITHYVAMMLLDDDDLGTLVYGDDIICRTEIVAPVTALLRFLGFTLNLEKSFWEGPFRESCGGDYFSGQAVRPYFMKESPNEPQDYIAAANAVRRASEESPRGFDPVRRAWFVLLDNLPSNIRRIRGPKDLGDLCIYDDEARWETKQRGFTTLNRVYRPWRTLNAVPWKIFDYDVQLACAVYGLTVGSGQQNPRNPRVKFKIGWITSYGVSWLPDNMRRTHVSERITGGWSARSVGYLTSGVEI